MENHTQVSEVFSYLSVIWCEIVRHVKRLVREWTDWNLRKSRRHEK